MILQSLAGLPAFLVYFCTAIVAVVTYLLVYTRVTPHDEFQLIRDNDPAAAIALGLSLLGFVLPVVSAIAHSANVVDCLIWSAIGSGVWITNQRRMRATWIFIQWWPRRLGRVAVAQRFVQQRFLIKPFVTRHFVRFRFGRRDAWRFRVVCAGVHVAFFRRRLTNRRRPHDPLE